MPPLSPTPLISVDISKRPWEQEKPLHNRWHPDIPAVSCTCMRHHMHYVLNPLLAPHAIANARPPAQVAQVSEGELFRVETVDWTGGQIRDDDCADDIKTVDLSQVRASTHARQQ